MINYFDNKTFYSEKEKESEDYLVGCIDRAIAELIVEKRYLKKAYNYYQGFRDKEQFRHLEENHGIGNPTSIEFIPLIRRHVDALVGEHLQNKIKPKVTCKDNKTLTKIEKEKRDAIYKAEIDRLRSQAAANISYSLLSAEEKQAMGNPVDMAVERELNKLKDDVSKNFISEFEIAAQYVLLNLIQSKSVDLYQKLKILFLDILIAGQCFYRVRTIREGETPKIEVLSPFDVFAEMIDGGSYVKKAPRVVYRRWMYKDQVLNEYGHHLNGEDLEELQNVTSDGYAHNYFFVRGGSAQGSIGLIADTGVALDPDFNPEDGFNYNYQNRFNLIPVYEVEWLSTNKVEVDGKTVYRMDRYKGVRIGQNIYVDMGKDETAIRSVENPLECTNSINGVYYTNRNGRPYSLVLATAHLQDEYDILHFYRNTLIANSGVKGDWIDVANLPDFLGQSSAERLLKFKAYKKQGLALINTAQEGRGANHNTIFNGFDDTVPGQAIQAIQLAIQQTEEICSSVTGVFRERLGGIEQRDAVTNVEVGVETSAIITKQYYQVMDNITTELLIDALNQCKESYKKGKVGSIILGNKMQQIFTIQPKYFSFTDYDVHIGDSGDIIRDMQKIEMLSMELIKSNQADIELVLEGITSESLTEMKTNVMTAYNKKKEENNALTQLQQQLEQAQQQLQQLQTQAQQISKENEMLKAKASEIEQKKVEYDYDVRKEANRNAREFNTNKIEIDKEKVTLEKLQLFDDNALNDEVKY